MIITLTGNLLAERTLVYSAWAAGKTQRAQTETFQVGGKGINVSKMLRRIGSATTAWCFVGGASGRECATWLADHKIPHRTFPAAPATRVGIVIRGEEQPETTFLGPDRAPDESALRACATALDDARGPDAVLALCGSFPGWQNADAEPLRAAVQRWAENGIVVADTYGAPLSWLVERRAALVKINRQEFDQLFPESERARSVVDRLLDAGNRWPVRRWVVTDGPGAVCYGGVDTPPGRVEPPVVKEISPTGSGDVAFACILHALFRLKLDLAASVDFALPYAAANAAHPGVAEFDLNNLPRPRSVPP